jgi:CubicO group peptidase (beta-lactamase class C family)
MVTDYLPGLKGGANEAIGSFGQSIYINPAERLIIVTNSAWAQADELPTYAVHDAYVDAVVKALHRGA